MKSKMIFALILVFGIILVGCKEKDEKIAIEEGKVDLLNEAFPEAQQEVKMTIDSIVQSVKDRDLDRLIAFHAYGPKFSEFKNGEVRNDGEDNEKFERGVFGSVTEISKFDMNDTKIAVYGNLANVTTHTDFHLKFGEDLVVVKDQRPCYS